MRFGNFELRFALVPWLAALVFFAFLTKLGVWQLNRAEEKRQILDAHARASILPPLLLANAGGDLRDLAYRRVVVEGVLDLDHQFLLDNQVLDKQVGFNVVTPLKSMQSKDLLLIDRGFVAIDGNREHLPEIDQACGEKSFTAAVYVPTSGYRLGEMDDLESAGWPRIIQFLDFDAIASRLGRTVSPVVLRLDPDAKCGFKRDWQWVSSLPVRHVGYAIQWFALAMTVLILFLVLSIKKR